MERTLSLVLDDSGFHSLTLLKQDSVELDNFTSKKFEDSEQIREYFKKEIEQYLKENENYINSVTKNTGRKFRGRIVILEPHQHGTELEFVEKRVLYKKHLVAFKEMANDKPTMTRFLKLEKIGYNEYNLRKLVSPFIEREIKYTNFNVATRVELIKRELRRNKRDFFDILRIISKAYEQERKTRPHLKTIEAIYKEHLETKKAKKEAKQEKTTASIYNLEGNYDDSPEKLCTIDGVSYPIDEIPFDLDDLINMETDYWPDGLGKKK